MVATLWQFRYSHFNEKVRWALDFKGWRHQRRTLVPGLHIPRALQLSGQMLTPILKIDGEILTDSTHIVEEIERRRPEPALFPADAAERQRALRLEDWFDEHGGPSGRRLFWAAYLPERGACARMSTSGYGGAVRLAYRALLPMLAPVIRKRMAIDEDSVRAARDEVMRCFDELEAQIGPSGYLVGDSFSVADLCAAAVLGAVVRPAGLPYQLPGRVPDAFARLGEEVDQRAGADWVRNIYRAHRGTPATSEI